MTTFLENTGSAFFEAREPSTNAAAVLHRDEQSDAATDYVLQVMPGFEALKYSASLCAGVLLLDLTGSDRTVRDRSLVDKARDAVREAEDAVLPAQPCGRAAHHHHHLCRALAGLKALLPRIERISRLATAAEAAAVTHELQACWEELRRAGDHLPGFETVDLSQSCCAWHARQVAAALND